MTDELMNDRRCFEILDLDEHATLATAKQAYRDLINIWHPDRYAHNYRLQKKAEEKTKEINAAYSRVKNFVSEREKRTAMMQNNSGKRSDGHAKNIDEEKSGKADSESKQEIWARTEARLAEIARKKRAADDRRAYFARMEAKKRVKKQEELYAEKKAFIKQSDQEEKKAADKKHAREKIKEKERRRVWLAAEAKLRKLAEVKAENLVRPQTFAGEKTEANTVPSKTPIILIRPVPLVTFCCTIILLSFFAGIAQNYTRVNLFILIVLAMAILFGGHVLVRLYKRKTIRLSLRLTTVICATLLLVFVALFILSSNPAINVISTVQALFTVK